MNPSTGSLPTSHSSSDASLDKILLTQHKTLMIKMDDRLQITVHLVYVISYM